MDFQDPDKLLEVYAVRIPNIPNTYGSCGIPEHKFIFSSQILFVRYGYRRYS